MTRVMRLLMLAGASLAAATAVAAQDRPPPGCRWQGGDTLACKDGKGYWRRSGDGEIVGTYLTGKPKPKPKPKAVAVAAPVVAAATAANAPPPLYNPPAIEAAASP